MCVDGTSARHPNPKPSVSQDAVHPRIAEVIGELDAARAELHALVAELTTDGNDAAVENGWTIPQVLEHLAMVEDGSGRIIAGIVKAVREKGASETSEAPVRDAIAQHAIATDERRIAAPSMLHPTQGLTVEESVARLDASRARLRAALVAASGLALEEASYPHPLFGPFNGYQWALATAHHERRHIRQIRRLAGLAPS